MGVRIRIKIETGGCTEEVVALANSAFESEEPEIVLPYSLATRLGFSLKECRKAVYRTAGGGAILYRAPIKPRVRIVVPDRETRSVECSASISRTEDEVILSDKLTARE